MTVVAALSFVKTICALQGKIRSRASFLLPNGGNPNRNAAQGAGSLQEQQVLQQFASFQQLLKHKPDLVCSSSLYDVCRAAAMATPIYSALLLTTLHNG